MAVVGVARPQDERPISYDGKDWSAELSWMVQTDSRTDGADTVSTATGLPAYGALYPNPVGASLWAKTIAYGPYESDAPMLWLVTVGYTSERSLDPTDPKNDEVLISNTGEVYQERIQRDRNGDAILNSAGDPFVDPQPTKDSTHMIFRIRANFQSAPTWFISHQNAVNNTAITIDGLAVGQYLARVNRIEASEPKKRGAVSYKEVMLEIHVRREGWAIDTLDAGMRERIAEGAAAKKHITNDNGGDLEEITEPVPLDGTGLRLANPTPFNSVFLDFDVYDALDFTILPGVS